MSRACLVTPGMLTDIGHSKNGNKYLESGHLFCPVIPIQL